MKTTFSELVIEGPFALVKGFLVGFLCTYPELPRYFLHRKVGIRRHTLRDLLSELFEFENLVHLCLEDSVVEEFKRAIARATPPISISIKSLKKIASTEFNFSFEIFDKTLADRCKGMFSNLPTMLALLTLNARTRPLKKTAHRVAMSLCMPIHIGEKVLSEAISVVSSIFTSNSSATSCPNSS